MEELKKIWSSHGYPGTQRLFDLSKAQGLTLSRKKVDDFVKGEATHQLHAKASKPIVNHPITTSAPLVEFQMDLLDMSRYSRANNGMNWILLVEDIFSRKGYAAAIKTKSPVNVLPALKNAIAELGQPIAIISDNGNEFEGGVNAWLESQNIGRRKAEVGDHRVLGVIDSLCKFYKNSLHRHFTHTQTTRYVEYLPQLTKAYNSTPHSSLSKMTPIEAEKNQTATRDIHYANVMGVEWKPKFKVGQQVRLLKKKNTFDRGYEIRYSLEIYTVKEIIGINYVLNDGRKVREFMIQSVGKAIMNKEDVEKKDVIKEAKVNRKVENILIHREGVDQTNRRAGLRERKPTDMVKDDRYGKISY